MAFPTPRLLCLFSGLLALGAAACGEEDAESSDSEADTDTDTDADTDADTDTDSDTDSDPTGDVMVPCQDLDFTVSCAKVVSGAQVCADYFGAWTEDFVRPQCEGAGGTASTSPCVLPDRFGTCVYYASEVPDYCYMEHIRGDAAAEAFWESTCPVVGEWFPN